MEAWWISFEQMCEKNKREDEERRRRLEAAAAYERHVAEYERYMAAYERYEAKAAAEAVRIAEEERAAAARESSFERFCTELTTTVTVEAETVAVEDVPAAEREAEVLLVAERATTVREAELEVVPEAEGVAASKVPAIQENEETERPIFVQKLQIGSSMAIPAQSGGELEFVRVVIPPIGDSRFAMLQIKYLGFVVSPIIVDFEIDGGRRPPRKPPDVFLPGGDPCCLVRDRYLLILSNRLPAKSPDSFLCGGAFAVVAGGSCLLVMAHRPLAKPPDSAEDGGERKADDGVKGSILAVTVKGKRPQKSGLPSEPLFHSSGSSPSCSKRKLGLAGVG